MTQSSLRAITTDTLGGIHAITDAISQESQRLTALENTVVASMESITSQLSGLQTPQAERAAIVASVAALQQSVSDVQSALNQLRESVG